MPKLSFATQDAVPEGLREFAAQEDGKFVVDVAPASKLAEFRDNNVKFLRERDEAAAALTTYRNTFGEDVAKSAAELAELRATAQQVKDGKLKLTGDIAAEVENRTKSAREQWETQLREQAAKRAEAEKLAEGYANKYRASVRDGAITQAVMAADSGVNPQALSDIMARAASIFSVDDNGEMVAKKNGAVLYGADGTKSMTVKEWLGSVLKEAPYLGKSSAGGGGGVSGDAKYGGLSKEQFDKLSPADRLAKAWNPKAA